MPLWISASCPSSCSPSARACVGSGTERTSSPIWIYSKYLDMQTDGPKPVKGAQKAVAVHTVGVQATGLPPGEDRNPA